jgi:hypothetical protein
MRSKEKATKGIRLQALQWPFDCTLLGQGEFMAKAKGAQQKRTINKNKNVKKAGHSHLKLVKGNKAVSQDQANKEGGRRQNPASGGVRGLS